MIVDNFIRIGFDELSKSEREKLEKQLTFVTDNGEIVTCFRKRITHGDYILPRGSWYLLPDHVRYRDQRTCPKGRALKFALKLDDTSIDPRFKRQAEAVEDMLREEQGLVIRPPGTGKTQIALAFVAQVKTPTLVLVHTRDLLEQWVDYAKKALPGARVGVIQGKRCTVGDITIAMVQTLNRYVDSKPKAWWAQFGALIADEAHHVSAATWENVINTCPARYRIGFTASPTRADGMERTMRYIVGPVIHRMAFTSSVKLSVRTVRTGFQFQYRGPYDWGNLLRALISDRPRNRKIARAVDKEVAEGNSVLVLSRRIEHLENIQELLVEDSEILAGRTRTKAERADILERFKSGELRVVLATQLADEALDITRLNRVMLVHPGKHEGRIIQQIGRALRQHPEKHDAIIYDFVDRKITPLNRQWKKRRHAYKKNDIRIRKRGRVKWH